MLDPRSDIFGYVLKEYPNSSAVKRGSNEQTVWKENITVSHNKHPALILFSCNIITFPCEKSHKFPVSGSQNTHPAPGNQYSKILFLLYFIILII